VTFLRLLIAAGVGQRLESQMFLDYWAPVARDFQPAINLSHVSATSSRMHVVRFKRREQDGSHRSTRFCRHFRGSWGSWA
jgi:hypothetical protein